MESRVANTAFWLVAAAVLGSACIVAAIDDRTLTPVFFYGDPEVIPGIRWTVIGAQLVVLMALLVPPLRRWGIQLAWTFATANLVALALNGFAGLTLFNYEGFPKWMAFKLLVFLAAQVVVLLAAGVCVIEEFRDNKVSRLRIALRVLTAVALTLAWSAGQWKLAAPTRFVIDGRSKGPVVQAARLIEESNHSAI
jgi:hypothetical protein